LRASSPLLLISEAIAITLLSTSLLEITSKESPYSLY
jgi:hypothetical protein